MAGTIYLYGPLQIYWLLSIIPTVVLYYRSFRPRVNLHQVYCAQRLWVAAVAELGVCAHLRSKTDHWWWWSDACPIPVIDPWFKVDNAQVLPLAFWSACTRDGHRLSVVDFTGLYKRVRHQFTVLDLKKYYNAGQSESNINRPQKCGVPALALIQRINSSWLELEWFLNWSSNTWRR